MSTEARYVIKDASFLDPIGPVFRHHTIHSGERCKILAFKEICQESQRGCLKETSKVPLLRPGKTRLLVLYADCIVAITESRWKVVISQINIKPFWEWFC